MGWNAYEQAYRFPVERWPTFTLTASAGGVLRGIGGTRNHAAWGRAAMANLRTSVRSREASRLAWTGLIR
jgi:hypothetical protein